MGERNGHIDCGVNSSTGAVAFKFNNLPEGSLMMREDSARELPLGFFFPIDGTSTALSSDVHEEKSVTPLRVA